MRFELLNKDELLAVYEAEYVCPDYFLNEVEQFAERFPNGFSPDYIEKWVDSRRAATSRSSMSLFARRIGIKTRLDLIEATHCVGLNDTFWMRREGEEIAWADVSPYRNAFDQTVAAASCGFNPGRYETDSPLRTPEFATDGSFAKCWQRGEDGQISLIKRGQGAFDGSPAPEPFSEVLAAQLLDAAGIDHVPYDLLEYRGELASSCPLFTSEEVGFVPMTRLFDRPFSTEDVLNLTEEHGCKSAFLEMVCVVDLLTCNTDRHTGNYGFLVDNDTGELLRFAPLFDHNLSCLSDMREGEEFDGYLRRVGPRIGNSFDSMVRLLLTPEIRAKLEGLRGFEYSDPGFDFPRWRLEALNRLKDMQIEAVLAGGKS